jgi:CHAP domain/Putative peptidoglycan binding domain
VSDEPVHVLEDDPAEEERKEQLEAAIREHGDPQGEPVEDEHEEAAGSAQTLIAEARKHLGYRESGENDTKFNRWLGTIPGYPHGGFGYPWCSSFVSYCLAHSQNANAGPRTAGCAVGVAWFRSRKRFGRSPQVGDIVYYGPGGKTHVEVVTAVAPGTITTIGGNTGGSLGGAYFNGDGVYEKTVARSSPSIHGYGKPAYAVKGGGRPPAGRGGGRVPAGRGGGGQSGGIATPMTSIRSILAQQEAVNALGYTPKLDLDGEWGARTDAGVKWLQRKVGAEPDGEWGATTEAKYKAHIT